MVNFRAVPSSFRVTVARTVSSPLYSLYSPAGRLVLLVMVMVLSLTSPATLPAEYTGATGFTVTVTSVLFTVLV